jgi:hypothetical protein
MAETAIDKVHVVNRALIKLGLPASYSVDAETELGGTVDLVWPGVFTEAVMLADNSDFRETLPCPEISGTPSNGWTYGFALPATRVGKPLAFLTDVVREQFLRAPNYMLEGGKLYTNTTPVWARVRVLLDPQYWDAGFVEAFATLLASALAVPLQQDEDTASMLRAKAVGEPREQGGGGMFGKLAALERAVQPQGRNFMANDPLTLARR